MLNLTNSKNFIMPKASQNDISHKSVLIQYMNSLMFNGTKLVNILSETDVANLKESYSKILLP